MQLNIAIVWEVPANHSSPKSKVSNAEFSTACQKIRDDFTVYDVKGFSSTGGLGSLLWYAVVWLSNLSAVFWRTPAAECSAVLNTSRID